MDSGMKTSAATALFQSWSFSVDRDGTRTGWGIQYAFFAAGGNRSHATRVLLLRAATNPPDGDALIAMTPDPEIESIRQDEERTLERLVAGLPEIYREVLILREVEDMDYRAIATVINVPLGTVMSRLARARAMLKEHWLQHVGGAPRGVLPPR
jgi:RNA polymerase sigma factor (sigma-70 family)